MTLNSNLALVHLKKEEFKDCLNKANEVLKEDPKNVKALVRRGQAQMMLINNDMAKEDFKRALELDPDNAELKKVIAVNNKRIAEQNKKQREIFGGRFAAKAIENPNSQVENTTTTTTTDTTESKEQEEVAVVESTEK